VLGQNHIVRSRIREKTDPARILLAATPRQ